MFPVLYTLKGNRIMQSCVQNLAIPYLILLRTHMQSYSLENCFFIYKMITVVSALLRYCDAQGDNVHEVQHKISSSNQMAPLVDPRGENRKPAPSSESSHSWAVGKKIRSQPLSVSWCHARAAGTTTRCQDLPVIQHHLWPTGKRTRSQPLPLSWRHAWAAGRTTRL